MIQKRHQDREAASEDFFSALEAKYGGQSSKNKKAKTEEASKAKKNPTKGRTAKK